MEKNKDTTFNTTNKIHNIISIILLVVLVMGIFLDIYMYITPSYKVSEIDLRLLGLEKLIYNIEEEE